MDRSMSSEETIFNQSNLITSLIGNEQIMH